MYSLLALTLLNFISPAASAQYYTRDSVNAPYTAGASPTTKMGVWKDPTFAGTSDKRPTIFFLHGAGEAGTLLSKVYNSINGGVPYRIEHTTFPTSFVNPVNAQAYGFLIFAPVRNNGWSASGDELEFIVKWAVANFRIDTSRIYFCGPSAGGAGAVEYIAHLDANESVTTGIRTFRAAAACPMSTATNDPQQSWGNIIVSDSVSVWAFGSVNSDVYGERAQTLTQKVNTAKANYARFTNYSGGHCCWDQFYDPAYKETIGGVSMNIYEWMLSKSRTQVPDPNPSAYAGSNQTVNLPTNSTSVTGSGTAGFGHTISSYLWTKVSGPTTYTITSPTATTTTLTNLVSGIYSFQFKVTNNIGATAVSTVQITVLSPNYGPPSVTITSPTQTITLPASSVTLTATPTTNGAGLNLVKWTKLSTPPSTGKKIGIIGSSTPAGTGATDDAHSYIHGNNSLVNTFYTNQGVLNGNITNPSVSGESIYSAMRTGYPNTGNQDPPDPANNITFALSQNWDYIFVDFNNKYDVYTFPEVKFAYQSLYDSAVAHQKLIYFLTPQPREDYTVGGQLALQQVRDSMIAWFPSNVINKYDPLVVTGTTQRLYPYGGDQIHSNDSGHLAISKKVIGANLFQFLNTSPAVINSPASQSTTITGLTAGIHKFLVTITDSHGQDAYAVATITVNNGPLNANAGSSQTITLPVNSVILDGSASTGAITSYLWTRVSGPNTPTIVTPTAVTTNITGLIAGTYVFQLSLNAGASTSQVTIIVNPAPVTGPCLNRKFTITPDPTDSSVFIGNATTTYGPGDTLVFNGAYSSIDISYLIGLPACPIVIINAGGVTTVSKRITLDGCRYVKLTGSGTGATYGFKIQQDPVLRLQSYHGIEIKNRSKCIEIERIQEHNVDMGIVAETNGQCEDSLNYPNWIMDSIIIHDNKIVGTWNEGMYLGNTSPDNGASSYDPRPIVCGGVTTYPMPMRNGYTKVYNNIVDSTGRGGIQLASASSGISEIYNNTVKHAGMNGDDAQGAGINIGTYARVYVHNNTITNTFTWGISSIGGSATNIPLRIENNIIDSSGYLNAYDLANTQRTSYNPNTEPIFTNVLPWPQSIEIDTRPTLFTDSTLFYVIGNSIGKKKNVTAINIDNDYLTLQKSGHIICTNVNTVGGTAATIAIVPGILYNTTSCQGSSKIRHKGAGRRLKRK